MTAEQGYFTSKDFLPPVMKASKPGICGCKIDGNKLPKLYGKVVILGAGDTAMDCATSAIRCGAKKVVLVFRRGFSEIRAVPEEFDIVKDERCELMPNSLPKGVICKDGRISGIELWKTESKDDGTCEIDEDQFVRLKCDFIISAFGSTVENQALIKASAPLVFNKSGRVDVNDSMATNVPFIFAGGDVSGSGTTVEASNDGKIASWNIHKYIQETLFNSKVSEKPELPNFFTEIDQIDLSVDVCGIKFPNPFGLASAPPSTTCAMIKRGFDAGWGFAVTKTFAMDHDLPYVVETI